MRKIYTFLCMLMLAAFSFGAAAVQITLNVDHADRMTVKVAYSPVTVVDGANTLEVPDEQYGATVSIDANEGYIISSVTDGTGASTGYGSMTSHSFSVYPSNAGSVYTVTTSSLEEARTASFTVTIDDPSQVVIMTSGTNQRLTFTDSVTVVKFIPEKETPMMIQPATYGTEFYSVSYTGAYGTEELQQSYGSYYFTPTDSSSVEIKTKFPDVAYPVAISATEEGYITSVKVDGADVENWASLQVQAGSKVSVSTASSGYAFTSLSLNGAVSSYASNPYEFIVKQATDLVFNVRKLGTITAYVTVDDPANVVVWKNYDSSTPLVLEVGRNTVTYEDTGYSQTIGFKASDCGILESVFQNGQDVTNSYSIYVNDGDEFVVTTSKIVRDKKAVLYLDGKGGQGFYYFSLQRQNRSDVNADNGYNEIEFMDADNPFNLGFATEANNGVVLVDDQPLSPMYEGGSTYELRLTDNAVVKIFLMGEPSKYDVTFDVASAIASSVSVVKDKIVPVDLSSSQTVHKGTVFTITPGFATPEIKVNGTLLEGNDGVYEFAVTENTTVTVTDRLLGVDAPAADTWQQDGPVYNMQGIRVADSKAGLAGLPAGIYICNGKKLLVK